MKKFKMLFCWGLVALFVPHILQAQGAAGVSIADARISDGAVCLQCDGGEHSVVLMYNNASSIDTLQKDGWAAVTGAGADKLCDSDVVSALEDSSDLRFYCVIEAGREEDIHIDRSRWLVLGVVKLHPGQNWVGLWGRPVINSVDAVLGDTLPAGDTPATSTRIIINQLPLGDLWLSKTEADGVRWLTASGEAAGDTPLPPTSAIRIDLPKSSGPVSLPLILKVPGSAILQSMPPGRRTLAGFRYPGSTRLQDSGLLRAGFKGGRNPVESDQLWKYDRENQRAPYAVWFNSGDKSWRLTAGSDFPHVLEPCFRYDDAVMIFPRKSTKPLIWNKPGFAGPALTD